MVKFQLTPIEKDNQFQFDKKIYKINGRLKVLLNFLIVMCWVTQALTFLISEKLVNRYFDFWPGSLLLILILYMEYKIYQYIVGYLIRYLLRNQSVIEN